MSDTYGRPTHSITFIIVGVVVAVVVILAVNAGCFVRRAKVKDVATTTAAAHPPPELPFYHTDIIHTPQYPPPAQQPTATSGGLPGYTPRPMESEATLKGGAGGRTEGWKRVLFAQDRRV